MRLAIALLVVAACGGGTDPKLIPGGGIADGDIDGKVFVHVIDSSDDAPLANATVAIGSQMGTTDAKGFVEIKDVDGPQHIAVKLQGYRNTVWAYANGKNVTIPLEKAPGSVPSATLAGSIAGWETISVPSGHAKGAIVLYSQTDDLGDPANDLMTPGGGNICGGTTCNWTLTSRTGTVSVLAAIIDRDFKGTVSPDDDTNTIIGWAVKTGVIVESGVNQSGMMLTLVEAGNMENITIDYGTPPAALTQKLAIVGIEVGDDEIVQIPVIDGITVPPGATSILMPKPSVFTATSYRLSAISQTTSGEMGAQSIVLRRNLSGPTLAAGTWLSPPVGVMVTRSTASWQLVAGAKLHSVEYRDATGNDILGVTCFDESATTVDIPPLVALPTSGTLQARVQGIAADIDLQDFSLEEDEEKLTALSVQPQPIN